MPRNNRKRLPISVHTCFETLELRQMMAAHIVGNATIYQTIQAAVNAAASGAVINVDPGSYAEQISINKPLTLRGSQAGVDARGAGRKNESILTGLPTVNGVTTALRIAASNVNVDGFIIQ